MINFAQLTQRAGNFLVAREPIEHFEWDMLKGKKVLGGRAGGMPEMVFEYILKQHNIDPTEDLSIDQSIDFGSTAAAFSGGQGDFTCLLYTSSMRRMKWLSSFCFRKRSVSCRFRKSWKWRWSIIIL